MSILNLTFILVKCGSYVYHIMSSRRNEFNAEVRFRILRLLNEYPNMSTRQIAKSVGISNGSNSVGGPPAGRCM